MAVTNSVKFYWIASTCFIVVSLQFMRIYMADIPSGRIRGSFETSIDSPIKKNGENFSIRSEDITEKTGAARPNPSKFHTLCENILNNITVGKWVTKTKSRSVMREFNLVEYAQNKLRTGTSRELRSWRDDGKCGSRHSQMQGSFGRTPSWCNPISDKYCCNDKENGICGKICTCERCVNSRDILHAEVSDWIPSDNRCRVHIYTRNDACRVSKMFSEIYFAGDSFIRKMARAFILLLTSKPYLVLRNNDKTRSACSKIGQFYYIACRLGNGSLAEQMEGNEFFCGTRNLKVFHLLPNFTSGVDIYHHQTRLKSSRLIHQQITRFLTIVKSLAGKKGSMILLSSGIFFQFNASDVISRIEPAVDYLKHYYNVQSLNDARNGAIWPHIIYLQPDMPGILKQTKFLKNQGREKCNEFAGEMKSYCDRSGIPVLDFRHLTTGVHSYDGTHYGFGVNMMKAQMLLNYLDATFTHHT